MIEVRGLSLAAGSFRLEAVDLDIAPGRVRAVVGPTGAGKSLLLEALVGLRPVTAGSVRSAGRDRPSPGDVTAEPPERRNFSYVPQDVCLFPHLTVRENIWFGLRARNRETEADRRFVDRLVELLGAGPLLDRRPASLSGGERQRVAVARGLAPQPDLLVMDEPFSSLDEASREETRRLLKDLFAELAVTALFVTHDIDEAHFLGDDVTVLLDGRVAQAGPGDDVYRFPKRTAIARFFGIRNLFCGTVAGVDERGVICRFAEAGGDLRVTCGCGRERYRPGDAVAFGIRPELIAVDGSCGRRMPGTPQDPASAAPDDFGPNRFAGTVERIYARGRLHTAVVRVGAARLEVDAGGLVLGRDLVPGSALALRLDPDLVFLLEG